MAYCTCHRLIEIQALAVVPYNPNSDTVIERYDPPHGPSRSF